MAMRIITMLAMTFCTIGLFAQTPTGVSFENVKNAPKMEWSCPEIEKYQGLLSSLHDDDEQVYAKNVMDKFQLYSDESSPSNKYLVTQAKLDIENPLFSTENLINHISTWIKKNKGWEKAIINIENSNKIRSSASINIANHASFLTVNKVSITPNLGILIEDSDIFVTFLVERYKNDEYSNNKRNGTSTPKISEVFPFTKSSYKNTYAKAYVATYIYFWNFISDLRDELNTNYSKDMKLLTQLHYEYSRDSLMAKYGEPTKVIAGLSPIQDINNEMHVYENAQKIVFMGKTIDFKDILSCEIVDDPKFIPGRTTTLGAGISFYGIGLGGADTYRTPDKTVHNYVVIIKIDNLGTPLIRIVTGQNEPKATEIASVFEYILRHRQSHKESEASKTRTSTKRTK